MVRSLLQPFLVLLLTLGLFLASKCFSKGELLENGSWR